MNKRNSLLSILKRALLSLALFTFFAFNLSAFPQGIEPSKLPAEEMIVIKNNKLIFDLFGETMTPVKVQDKGIVKSPKFGKVKFNKDESITYQPSKDVCEETDEFTYFIKSKKGIDTLQIKVEILCESLTIMSGFTPDGDGENDTFTILGVQNYPNNSLLIFNKWGEQIYSKNNYSNDWSGGENEGKNYASEDSVYYYVFEDGKGQSYSGYLQILAQK